MNGNLDTSDVLLNRGLNGSFLGGSQGNFLGDGSAVKEAVRGNRDIQLLESVNKGTDAQFLGNQIDRGHSGIVDTIRSGQDFLSAQITEQRNEFRFAAIERQAVANQSALTAQLSTAAVAAAECCCELRAGQAAINAKLDAASAIAAKDAEIQRLNLQILIDANGRHGH